MEARGPRAWWGRIRGACGETDLCDVILDRLACCESKHLENTEHLDTMRPAWLQCSLFTRLERHVVDQVRVEKGEEEGDLSKDRGHCIPEGLALTKARE